MDTAKRSVVVGVDRSPEALVAARYALWQAELRGLDLVLVHAYPLPAMEAWPVGDVYTVLREVGEAVVAAVLEQLAVPATVRVRTLLGQTAPVMLLRQAAETAEMVVVGQDHVGLVEWLVAGNVAAPLCRSAPCPVVVVPRGWELGAMNRHPVVVALDGTSDATGVLQAAFEAAHLLDTPVLALKAMPVNAWPRDVAAAERNVAEVLAGFRQDNPDVQVSVLTVAGDPRTALVESSLSASVLVVGTPHTEGLAVWTRSVARSVVNRAECPVVVAPRSLGGTPPDSASASDIAMDLLDVR